MEGRDSWGIILDALGGGGGSRRVTGGQESNFRGDLVHLN